MSELYKGMAGSPITYLASDISAGQTTISVADDTALPDAPNICTIGYGEELETIKYGTKSNGVLQNVTRGIEGAPRTWQAGTEVARFFTAYDHDAIVHGLAWEEYTNLTLQNGWTGTLRVRRHSLDLVHIYGEITPGVTDIGTTITNLPGGPGGYRPGWVIPLPAQSASINIGGIVGLAITTSGNLNIYGTAGDNVGVAVRINYLYRI